MWGQVREQTEQNNMKNLSKTILAVLATSVISCGLLCQQAQALSTDTLANLAANANNSISIGDKTFNNFSFLNTNLTSFDASQIHVTASIVGGIYYLAYTGNISLFTTSTTGATADLLLGYRVTASAGTIFMIDQDYAGNVGSGIGSISVAEVVKDINGNVVGNSNLSTGDISDPAFEIGSDQPFINPPQNVLNVTKDIGFGASATDANTPGHVSISLVEQSFHQQVPDGGSAVALLGIALAGIEGVRRLVRTRKA
jgi:hypothetical protein